MFEQFQNVTVRGLTARPFSCYCKRVTIVTKFSALRVKPSGFSDEEVRKAIAYLVDSEYCMIPSRIFMGNDNLFASRDMGNIPISELTLNAIDGSIL